MPRGHRFASLASWVDAHGGVGATLRESKNRLFGNLVHEAYAARAHDAALIVETNARPDLHILGLFDLIFLEA